MVITAVSLRLSWGGSYWVFGAVAGVLALGCALQRHRGVPAVVAGFVVAATAIGVSATAGLPREPGPVVVLALAVLVASVVREAGVRTASGVVLGGLAIVAGAWATGGVTAVPALVTVGWACAAGVGLGLRTLDDRRRTAREQVRREERLELARELHDVVAHHVTGIVVQAQAAQLAARRSATPPPVHDALAGIEAAGSEALAAMRRVVRVLRDPSDAAPLVPEGLPALLDRFAQRGGPRVHRSIASGDWPPEVTTTVYRVVQEALSNVSQHAPTAGSVSVRVAESPDRLTVEVTDDAPAAALRHRGGGHGLVGMRERVESLGGNLAAGPGETGGWSVRAVLPR